MKIVSLIPSSTEIVDFLGMSKNLIGVSHECDNPLLVKDLPILTRSKIKINQNSLNIDKDIKKILHLGLSVYNVKTELLKNLNPDVIITQSQCSVCAVSLDQLKKSLGAWLEGNPKLIDLSPNSFNDILNDILKVGEFLNVSSNAIEKVNYIKTLVKEIKKKLINEKKKKVLCIEWLNPLMVAGNWIPDLLNFSNAESLMIKSGSNSNFIKLKNLVKLKVDKVILMPCGFDINRTKKELKYLDKDFDAFFHNKEVFLVDGNRFFNRPGPSILESLFILCEIIHPDIFQPKPSNKRWIKL